MITVLTRITQHGKLHKRKHMTGSLLPGKFSLSLPRPGDLSFQERTRNRMETHIVQPRCQTVAIATVELVETLHQSIPDAVIKPSEPFEDEDVCLTVYGLWDVEDLQRIRNQIYQ